MAGVACWDPPMVSVTINNVRHIKKGILENKEFSVNIPAANKTWRRTTMILFQEARSKGL